MNDAPLLSVCMIVKNEAANMAEALSDYRLFADEIIVVDTGSTDATREIALRYTPHVLDFPWIGDFSAARNHSIDHAAGRYILWLDADDRISPEMGRRINDLKARFDGVTAFYFLLENRHSERNASYCYQLRCFPRHPRLRFRGRIHEQIIGPAAELGLPLVRTDITVVHVGYMDHGVCMEKMHRNLALLLGEYEEHPEEPGPCLFLAYTHEALKHDDEAAGFMEKGVRLMEKLHFDHHTLMEGYLFLARNYERNGKKREALAMLVRAHALAEDCTQHFYQIGLLYQKLGRYAQAAACLEEALGRPFTPNLFPSTELPPEEDIRLEAGFSRLCMGDRDGASARVRRAVELGMKESAAWERLGAWALASGRTEDALRTLERAEAAGTMSADGFSNFGLAFRKAGHATQAAARFRRALAIDPRHSDAAVNLGHLCLMAGRPAEAKEAFRRLPATGELPTDVLLALAVIAVQERNFADLGDLRRRLSEHSSLASFGLPGESVDFAGYFRGLAGALDQTGRPAMARWAGELAGSLEKSRGKR